MLNHQKSKVSIFISLPLFFLRIIFISVISTGIFIGIFFYLQIIGFYKYQVPVSGASMLPTLPETGRVEFLKFYNFEKFKLPEIFNQKISRGDIVVFENELTNKELKKQAKASSGFVKRVVGVEGDTVEIENGFVKVNNIKIDEGYTLKPRSTFGGREINDCSLIKVPKEKLFVLGDNRKISMDSRQIGLISIKDVEFFIPFKDQESRFSEKWRDTANDLLTENNSLFDTKKYLNLLNQERSKNNLSLLKYDSKLERSAMLRARKILEKNEYGRKDFVSDYDMKKAMSDVGYSNILYGEFPMLGYYDEQELYDVFMEQPESKDFLLNKDYDDIGVATFIGETNGCPVQIVVQHLAGYVPPKYTQQDKSNWESAVSSLKKVQEGWLKLKEFDGFYEQNKAEIDRINEIIALRILRSEIILEKIIRSQWLTKEEEGWMKEDISLAEEQNKLADKLNSAK